MNKEKSINTKQSKRTCERIDQHVSSVYEAGHLCHVLSAFTTAENRHYVAVLCEITGNLDKSPGFVFLISECRDRKGPTRERGFTCENDTIQNIIAETVHSDTSLIQKSKLVKRTVRQPWGLPVLRFSVSKARPRASMRKSQFYRSETIDSIMPCVWKRLKNDPRIN